MQDLKQIKPERTEATGFAEQIAAAQAGDSAKDQGFKNVNQKWLAKTLSFAEGIDRLTAGKAETEDITLPLEKVSFEESDKQLVFNLDGNLFHPTEYALRQMGTKLGIPNKVLTNWWSGDSTDITLVGDILSNGQRHYIEGKVEYDEDGKEVEKDPVDWLFRTRKNGSLRACLSTKYARLDNQFFLESLEKIVPEGRLSHWDKSDGADTIYGNILIPDSLRQESDSMYGGGLSVGNSEIGSRVLSCHPWLFRWCCFNGTLWDQIKGVSYTRKHLGAKIDYKKIFESLLLHINKQIPLIPEHIDAMQNTKKLKWSSTVEKLIAQSTSDLLLSKKQATLVLENYSVEPELSCFGLINALTRAGQLMPSDKWVQIDSYVSKLTNENFWKKYSEKAMVLTQEDAQSYFVVAS